MIEGHSEHQVDAWLEEAVCASKVSDFTFTAAEQRADGSTDRLGTSTLVHTNTQVHRVALRPLLTPVCNQSQTGL